MRTPRRLSAALLVVSATLALGACGGHAEEDGVIKGESEGVYITLSDVKYQVQLSRILNPGNPEDEAYLAGLLPTTRELDRGETWFGVWLRAENESEGPKPKAEEFEILDTLGNRFQPLLQPDNALAWATQPERMEPAGEVYDVLPRRGSIASQTSIQGSLLLFKLPYAALENRPLELEVKDPLTPDRAGTITLDV